MQINKFKKIGKNRYKVFIGDTDLILYEDIILKYELLIKHDIDIELLDKVMNENRYYEAYNLALNYIDIKMRSKKEIIDYLKKKDLDEDYIDFAIKKLDDLGLLNTTKYIEAYVNDKINLSNDGPYKIKRTLLENDFEESIIDNYLNKINSSTWKEKLDNIVSKRSKLLKNKSYFMLINKLRNDLYNLGYEKDMIEESLSIIEYDNSNIKKEVEKSYKKFKGNKTKIINSLLRKGYSYEEVNNSLQNLDIDL